MQRLFKWLARKISPDKAAPQNTLRRTGDRRVPPPRPAAIQRHPKIDTVDVDVETELSGKIEDGGPGKNVLVRNKYVREDTGTHETLTIIDESLLQADEDDGLDPYNTGRFDSSKSWDSSRSRK
jgi:hypothetical protein